jgi:hypothetical protein
MISWKSVGRFFPVLFTLNPKRLPEPAGNPNPRIPVQVKSKGTKTGTSKLRMIPLITAKSESLVPTSL